MSETFLTALSAISTICAIFFGYKAFVRNRDKDKERDARTDATVLFVSRLTAVEASAKQAHKRIDTLEERQNK